MNRGEVYQRRNKFFVVAYSCTVDGVFIMTPPVVSLDMECRDSEVGAAIVLVLDGSRVGVPHPNRDAIKLISKPLLDAAGVKSWNLFERLATAVALESVGHRVVIVPLEHAARGYVEERSRSATVNSVETSELGGRVRGLLAKESS